MCGIAGIVYKDRKPDYKEIKQMTDTIAHRGPDGEGFYFGDNFALGHRRLAIIDLSDAGYQPMHYRGKNGDYVIVYNGEIYNYIELREQLKRDGYTFNSNTDTEVILASYDKWGGDCLSRFNGMWAFVIYDKKREILFGSRDRFGVKPFYYILNDFSFAFASEIKTLLNLRFYKPNINDKAVFDYLAFGKEEQEEEGFLKGIYELFPSYAFIVNLKNFVFKKWRYYKLDFNENYEKFNEKLLGIYANEVFRLIFQAVSLRLRADVPIGTCLSGGLDSSSIVCVINELLKDKKINQIGEKQKVFTASYKNESIDESRWAKIVVEATNTDWYVTYPNSSELFMDLEDLIYYQDIPFGSTSIYAQYRVMKLSKEKNVKVLLDGQGGDELFTGYTGYYPTFLIELLDNIDLKSFLRELYHLKNSPVTYSFIFNRIMTFHAIRIIPKKFFLPIINTFIYPMKILNIEFLHAYKDRIAEFIESRPKNLNRQLYHLISGGLKTLLRYEDRNSMRFGLESRTPFADDKDLIEYVFNIPSTYKIHNGWSKYILRESMRNVLPKEIIKRTDKIGFATPEKNWLNTKKEWIKSLLEENKLTLSKYLNYKKIIKDIRSDLIFNKGFILWRIINLIIWRKIFKV